LLIFNSCGQFYNIFYGLYSKETVGTRFYREISLHCIAKLSWRNGNHAKPNKLLPFYYQEKRRKEGEKFSIPSSNNTNTIFLRGACSAESVASKDLLFNFCQ
jgi:hypothetical protein